MLRLLAVFLPFYICFLFGTCSKEKVALLPGETVVNASELPGPIQKWKRDSASERILTIYLDCPGLPWSHVAEGMAEAYAHGVNDLRLRRGDAVVSAFENGICWDIPVVVDTETELDLKFEKNVETDVPNLPDDTVLEHLFRENVFLSVKKTPSREPAYPIVQFIRSSYPERGSYQLIYWRIRKEGAEERRKNDIQVFANMANADINQHRAFIFNVDDEVPCGEVFDYLNAIDGRGTLVGMSFSQPGNFPEKNS